MVIDGDGEGYSVICVNFDDAIGNCDGGDSTNNGGGVDNVMV